MSHTIAAVAVPRTTTWRGDREAMVEFVDLVALRPIRRKDGTKAVRMADGTLLEVVPVKFLCGQRPYGTWMGEGHPSYLWWMGFVIALLNAGYKVISPRTTSSPSRNSRRTSSRSRSGACSPRLSTPASRWAK